MNTFKYVVFLIMFSVAGTIFATTSGTVGVNFVNKSEYLLVIQNKNPTNYLCRLPDGGINIKLTPNCESKAQNIAWNKELTVQLNASNPMICIDGSSQSFSNLEASANIYLIQNKSGPMGIAPNEPLYEQVSSGNIDKCHTAPGSS